MEPISNSVSDATEKNVDWKFNPPAGSHHIGTWERIIRSIRKAMNSVLKEQVLDDQGLREHTYVRNRFSDQ